MSVSPISQERAEFATAARLLSCLVTESLVRAIYSSLDAAHADHGAAGFATLLKGEVSLGRSQLNAEHILAIVPLHHPPIFKHDSTTSPREIGLLDPLDMLPLVFGCVSSNPAKLVAEKTLEGGLHTVIARSMVEVGFNLSGSQIHRVQDALSLWIKFATSYKLDEDIKSEIANELSSAIKWQAYSYEHPPPAPSFLSPSIDWEQSIVEGHPTHPMHKTRRFLSPLPDHSPGDYDLYHPHLRFISLPREQLKITFGFEALIDPLIQMVSGRARQNFTIPNGHVIVPVHELQIIHIQDKFPDAVVYPDGFSLPLLAQQSLRSVIIPDGYSKLHLKLAVGMKLTSAVRTISPESAYLGPRFSAAVVPVLTMDREIVTVAKELASVVHAHPNGEIAKHCAVIVRECPENTSEDRNERLIVCTSLVERGHAGTDGQTPSVVRAFDLDTEEKRLQWFDNFVSIFLKAFLPPMIHNGVAFECHPQNCVARFDLDSKELKGFIVRDFGGLKVHVKTLKATTGVDLDFIAGHSVIAPTLGDVYARMYHTIMHNHFQQLARVLDIHYNGLGWNVVRKQLRQNIPSDHPLYSAWLSPDRRTFPGKCFLRMRMAGAYRFHLHGPFPNLIHYEGCRGA